MGLWEVVAKVGGIVNVFKILFAYLFNKYALINFKVHIINQFFKACSHDSVLKFDDDENVLVSTCDKFRLMADLCPNKRLKRFILRCEKKLKRDFDITNIIKDIKKLQQHHKPDVELKHAKAHINVESSTSSDENATPL